jgi:hypothetical protein
MKLRYLLILSLILSAVPNAHAGGPRQKAGKAIAELLGIGDELNLPKSPKAPDAPSAPRQPGGPTGPQAPRLPDAPEGSGLPAGADDVDQRARIAREVDDVADQLPFGGRNPIQGDDPVPLPIGGISHNDAGEHFDIDVGPPTRKSNPKDVKDQQVLVLEPKNPEAKGKLFKALNEWLKSHGQDTIPEPANLGDVKPKIRSYFHNYTDPNMPENFGVNIIISGSKEYKVLRPPGSNIGPAIAIVPETGDVIINPGTVLYPKRDYGDIVNGKKSGARFGEGGVLEVDGEVIGDPHWPPGYY